MAGFMRLTSCLFAGAMALICVMSLFEAAGGGRGVWVTFPSAWLVPGQVLLAAIGALISFVAVRQCHLPSPVRGVAAGLAYALAVLAVADAVKYFSLLGGGTIRSVLPIPLSLIVAGLLFWGARTLGCATVRQQNIVRKPQSLLWQVVRTTAFGSGALAMMLALLFTFGATDYRRQADCAIVLGARAYADGTPSLALADRVDEGIRLYREGRVRALIFSGGPGDGEMSEPRVMRARAINAGVPPGVILLDERGVNTRTSAANCRALMDAHGWQRAIVVSHYYHLARCKTSFSRVGVGAVTVPARMSRRLTREPYFILRECAASLAYAL